MFFMMGITDGRKDFDFNQVITCDECGRYSKRRGRGDIATAFAACKPAVWLWL